MVGKYTGLSDSYLSVVKALEHASIEIERRVVIDWIEASDLEPISVCDYVCLRNQVRKGVMWAQERDDGALTRVYRN